jgi:hypothetical protein
MGKNERYLKDFLVKIWYSLKIIVLNFRKLRLLCR